MKTARTSKSYQSWVLSLLFALLAAGCSLQGQIKSTSTAASKSDRVFSISDSSWLNFGNSTSKIRWTDTDYNSTVQYEVAVGSSAGASNIVSWTNVGNVLQTQFTGLALTDQQKYFVSIRTTNDRSKVFMSDGWSYRLNGVNAYQNFSSFNVTAYPRDVITYDLNRDGYPDIVSADGSGSGNNVSVTLSNGSGGFLPAYQLSPPANNPQGLRIADVVGDSNPDLIVALYGAWGINIFPGRGDGTFDSNIYLNLSSITSIDLGDINNDGLLDIIATSDLAADCVYVLLNNNKSFDVNLKITYSVPDNPKTAILGDWNKDNKLDIAEVSENADKLGIMFGNGDGTFMPRTDYAAPGFPRGLAALDFDQDGDLDLVVSSYNTNIVTQFINNGSGAFSPAAIILTCPGNPHGITVADINLDGIDDLVVASNASAGVGSNSVGVFIGDGVSGFSSRMEYATGPSPMRTTVADLNKDGLMDILVANGGSGTNQSTISVLYGK